jgi:hypothetical protein
MTEANYPIKRDLDGVYFRVKRGDRWESVCFSDLTDTERHEMCVGRSQEWLVSLACILGDVLHGLGDALDIVCGDE